MAHAHTLNGPDPPVDGMVELRAKLVQAEQTANFHYQRAEELRAACESLHQRALEAEAELSKVKGRLN